MAILVRRQLTATLGSFTRPNDTTTYALGELVANHGTAGSVTPLTFNVPAVGQPLMIRRCKITKSAGPVANGSFRVHFFSGTVAVSNGDNGAFVPASMSLYLGYIDVTMVSTLGGWGWATDDGAVLWTPAASTDLLNVLIEVRAAYVPTALEVFTVVPEVEYTHY